MRHTSRLLIACAALAAPVLLAPAADAGTRDTIDFTDHRVGIAETSSSSVTTDLADCPTAEAVDLSAHVADGVFFGVRDFQCGDGSGFVVRLTARFGGDGSFGSWSIVDSYGALTGLRGTGKIEGTLFDLDGNGEPDGIDDHYTGYITWTG